MNNGNGFILLHKSLEKHWISSNAEYFKAWVFMLFNACYEPYKTFCKGQLIPVEVGEIALSYDGWVKIFGKHWTLQKVRTFFDLLESDKMITRIEGYKVTKLSIVNYATYQIKQQVDNKIEPPKVTGTQQVDNKQVTTIEIKETKGLKKRNKEIPTSDEVRSLFIGYLALLNITDYDIDRTDGQIRAFIRYYIGDEDSKGVWQTTRKKFNPKSCVKNWIDKNPNIYKPYKKADPEPPQYSTWLEAIYGEASKDPKIYPGKVENYMNWRDQNGFFDGWEYERIIKHAINQCKKDENRCKSEV